HRDLTPFPTRRSSDLKAHHDTWRDIDEAHAPVRFIKDDTGNFQVAVADLQGIAHRQAQPCQHGGIHPYGAFLRRLRDILRSTAVDRKSTRLNSSHVKI